MRKLMMAGMVFLVTGILQSSAGEGDDDNPSKVLFIYDKTDQVSKFHIDAFRDGFKSAGGAVDEAAVDGKNPADLSSYGTLVIYSMVMAFDNISPVRSWLKNEKTLKGKRVFIFVTANRWFIDKHLKKLQLLVRERGGEVVDGMTMATSKMSEDQKREAVMKMVEKAGR